MERQRWHPWLLAAIGLWLIVSPYVLGVPFEDAAQAGTFRWSFVGPGSLVLLLAIGGLTAHQRWETGLAAAVGMWLLATPWVVGFVDAPAALYSAVMAGLIMIALGVSSIVSELTRHVH